jgi:hypothetical protein
MCQSDILELHKRLKKTLSRYDQKSTQDTNRIQYELKSRELLLNKVFLGGLVVSVLGLDPSFAVSNTVEDDGFLRKIKIRSMTSLGGEAKPSIPCPNILRQVKEG